MNIANLSYFQKNFKISVHLLRDQPTGVEFNADSEYITKIILASKIK